jgi:heterodisulfide reductase subunit A-like polyferredoxin
MPSETVEKLTAIIDSPLQAQEATAELYEEGFAREDITVMSAEPLPAFMSEFDSRSRGRATLLVIGGGFAGAFAAIALTVWTAKRMGLVTGGMPIVTPWAFGIIVYELIALGAILTTLVITVYEAGLLRSAQPSPEVDRAIADGKVAVAVRCPTEISRSVAEAIFAKSGAQVY